ncbi:hypothetical protein KGM_204702 [Danaus plexippus plexippus]|uniref:Uncharacterized protein n=1 Tax=Danaus plexippus plexippus TaxID=278856 RepID=A0A212F6C2_DANPL|nr:hypothetical protein KGM_204702 [Danaus plexippus plexippus]
MRLVVLLALLLCSVTISHGFEDTNLEDDDFAEFEQFESNDENEAEVSSI